MKKWSTKLLSPVRVLLAGMSVGALALLVPMVVSAVAPPANTNIGNKASATYLDAAGQPQFVQSNQVSTTVAQAGALTLTNDNIKSTSVGSTVSMPHTLTNTGNGTDTFKITVADTGTNSGFSNISIYADPSGTGQPSGPALCSTGGTPTCSAGFNQTLAANTSLSFVVTYQVPATATAPATPFDTATVTVVPTSTGIPYPTGTVSRTDTVNLTTGAAFSARKSLSAPAVPPPSGAWPAIATTGKPSDASCGTTWPITNSTSPLCTYTVYTIDYSNIGAAAGAFSMEDTIPAGMTFVTGSAVWSGNGGVAMNDSATLPVTGASKSSYNTTTKKFTAIISSVNPNVSGTISFAVLINKDATVGTEKTNNIADFFTTTCDLSAGITASNCITSTPPAHTNPSPFPITQTYGVVAANIASTTPDAAHPPTKDGINLVQKPSVAPGGSVSFDDFVVNTGDAVDTFNLSISDSTFPAGTSFQFLKGDGVTAWLDSNNDNIPDTGPVTPGIANAVKVILRATIPTNTATGAGPFIALVTARSVGNGALLPLVLDSVWNEVLTVTATVQKVDLTNTATGNKTILNGVQTGACTPGVNCDLGAGPSSGPTDTETTTPGVGVLIPLYIKNNDAVDGSYNLTTPSLPVGWTVKFVASGGTCASDAISQPVNVLTTAQLDVKACVTPPNNAPVGTPNVYFKVTSATNPAITDTITDAVAVTELQVKALSLTPATGNNTVAGGGTVVQPATLTNIGNQNCGTTEGFNVTVTLDAASIAAQWSATVYYDLATVGVIGANDKLLGAATASGAGNFNSTLAPTLIPLNPGENVPLLVKFFAPSNAVNGAIATATLTVVDRSTDACPTQTSKFQATVANGLLRIQKLQALETTCTGATVPDAAFTADQLQVKPGECLVYRVITTNDGNAPVSNVVINDAAPAFTTHLASPTTASTCAVSGAGTGSVAPSFAATAAGLVSCSGGTTAPGVVLSPLGSMTMQFPVKVNSNP